MNTGNRWLIFLPIFLFAFPFSPLRSEEKSADDVLKNLLEKAENDVSYTVKITDSGPSTFRGGPQTGGREGYEYLRRKISLNTGKIIYTLKYLMEQDADNPANYRALTHDTGGYSGIGLCEPFMCNWYGNDFLDIRINGNHSTATRLATFTVASTGGKQGTVNAAWSVPEGILMCKFKVFAGDDKLYMEFLFIPEKDIESFDVTLGCYPCSFAEPRDRQIITAAGEESHDKKVTLSGDSYWVLYTDKNLDYPKGGGPCALLYLPSETNSAAVDVQNYRINTTISFKTGKREPVKTSVVLWEFPKKTNQEALDYMKANAEKVREFLETGSN